MTVLLQDPTSHAVKRQELLETVAGLRDILEAHCEASEAQGKLADASVAALQKAGLYGLKLPTALGGIEADPLLQMEIIEAVSRIHPTAAWSLFICGTGIGLAGAFLPEEGMKQVFSRGAIPIAAGVLRPWAQAALVTGGYRVSGRWPFASGIRNSSWFCGGTATSSGETRMIFVPVSQLTVHDTWQVLGLQGTGSCDVSADDLFVPQERTWISWENPQRGGALYRLGRPAFVAAEHAAFAFGTSRLALDTIVTLAQDKHRGYTTSVPTAHRATFQRDLGEADVKLRAARSLMMTVYGDVWSTVCAGQPLTPQQQVETRSATCYATQVAADVALMAFRYGGGEANYLASRLQRCLRDVYGAAQHQLVDTDAYEEHARGLLGLTASR